MLSFLWSCVGVAGFLGSIAVLFVTRDPLWAVTAAVLYHCFGETDLVKTQADWEKAMVQSGLTHGKGMNAL